MILLDKPYVSNFLKHTIQENGYPALALSPKEALNLNESIDLIDNEEAISIVKGNGYPMFYTNSENSIDWIEKNLHQTKLPGIIDLFKDKVRFRRFLKEFYPDYFFEEISIDDLLTVDASGYPFPVVLKPKVGFFSVGVHKINSVKEWNEKVRKVEAEIEKVNTLYPASVLNAGSFIAEQYVEGDEYAFDAYFNSNGEPVILNIFKHFFSNEDDVGDRVYLSSGEIINEKLKPFTEFLAQLGSSADLKNFPLHAEVRITKDGTLFPIEINPMRFGGWCTTADSTYFSYGFNPIEYFFNQQKPDWKTILSGRENKLYSIILLDNTTGYEPEDIRSFDYDKLLQNFEHPLELRKMNVAVYHMFGFLFCETERSNFKEIEDILRSDLTEFIEVE
ncbi:ATP-grasp domain-containing protein [Gracilimonas sp. Q87]|uniref:ATP-grasp domain-containing protein n=1 Tax=Gracilimonas sp. Q87 TaxID=3384766 RepID=UPI003983E13C